MKRKFLVNYRPSLGSFLDEKDIQWATILKGGNEYIYIFCKSSAELFDIGIDYRKWLENKNAKRSYKIAALKDNQENFDRGFITREQWQEKITEIENE